jgi:DNA-directed RNA polymerase subunit RPC12/RpoP
MKTLEEHNSEQWQIHEQSRKLNDPHPNGIACPKCGKELWDSLPGMTLTSYPPQKNIHCPECGHVGYRLA